MKRLIIALSLLFLNRTIYVSTSGNDQNPCTQASPCRSITHGIAVASAGDVVLVSAGTYVENVNVNKAITLQADGKVILDGSNLPTQSGGGVINIPAGTVATVRGFEIQNAKTYGISVFSTGSTIVNNIIHDVKGAGVWMRDGKYNVFESNEIYRTVLDNASGTSCSPTATGWASAINSWGAAGSNIWRNNYVHDNCGEGMVVYNGDLVEGNTFRDNWSVEIYIVDGFATVRNNTITDTKPYIVRGSDQSWRAVPSGISIGDESTCKATDNTISGNKITGSRYGVAFYAYVACSGLKNTVILENAITDAREYGFRILTGNHVNTKIMGNIITLSGPIARVMTIQTGAIIITGNVFYSDATIFEYNGKSYPTFTAWSWVVAGNVWGVPTVIVTDTPVSTETPTIQPTFTNTPLLPTSVVIPSKTPTPKPTSCAVIYQAADANILACTK